MDEKIESNQKEIVFIKDFLYKKYRLLIADADTYVGKIGDLASVKSGYSFKSSMWSDSGVGVIKIKNITETGFMDFSDCSYVDDIDTIQKASSFCVNGGELVIAMTGATIGKMALVPNLKSFCLVNQRVGLFYEAQQKECSPYLYASMLRQDVVNEIITRGGGSAQPNISGQSIEDISIPLVSDKKIAEFNNKYKHILLKMRHLLEANEKLHELKQLYLKKFFG